MIFYITSGSEKTIRLRISDKMNHSDVVSFKILLIIVFFGVLSAGCLQESGTGRDFLSVSDSPDPDCDTDSDEYEFLSEIDPDSLNFEDGINFICEAQLFRVLYAEKWTSPIKIRCMGDPTEEDKRVLNGIITEFNTVNGFPGMDLVDSDENVLLIYAPKKDMQNIQQKYGLKNIDKGVCQRESADHRIEKAMIVIESDCDQQYKNCVVLHEMFHLVGFYDHVRNGSSVINQNGSPVPELSDLDTLAFRMLYHPEIAAGMTYSEILEYYSGNEIPDIFPQKPSLRYLYAAPAVCSFVQAIRPAKTR